MADNQDHKNVKKKRGAPRKTMHALEKRMMLDASTLVTAVRAIPNAVINLDAQDVDGDGDFSVGDQPTNGSAVGTWVDSTALGGSNDASEATASQQPTYQTDVFKTGVGGLYFDGNDTYTIFNESLVNVRGPFPEKSFAFVFRTG